MVNKREVHFEAVLREHGAMLNRIAASYEFDRDLQADLLQNIALTLWNALPKFEGRSSLKTFVARMAHFQGASHVGRQSRIPTATELDMNLPCAKPSVEDQVGTGHKREKLIAAAHALPLKLRQVAILALEGFEAREIADTLGISANNAAVRLNRAKSVLREVLEHE